MQAAVPCLNVVAEARVNTVCLLKIRDFGFVYTKKVIMVALAMNCAVILIIFQVISLSSKTGGKNSAHTAITDSSNIAAVSNIGMQLFEHMYGREFQVIPEATVSFLTKQFGLINQICFLSLLSSSPDIPARSTSFELAAMDHTLYQELQSGHRKFTNAMTLFAKKKQNDS